MIQLLKNGKFRKTEITITRLIAGVVTNGDGFPITESLLQDIGSYGPISTEYLATMTDAAFDLRVAGFKLWLKSKYNFVTDEMLNIAFSGTDELLCVPDVIESQSEVVINQETNLLIYFDNTGSMSNTYDKLDTMRRTLFKQKLISFYNNDDVLYESKVRLINFTNERAFKAMNHNDITISGSTLVMVFQNEANGAQSYYHSVPFNGVSHLNMRNDILTLKNRIDSSLANTWKAVSFHVTGNSSWINSTNAYKNLMLAVENGNNGFEASENNLTSYPEVKFVYDLNEGATPEYYLDVVINTMRQMGYRI